MDLAATFVFAISGATRGVHKRLDLFGVLVVAWVAGVAGGIFRDLMIGAVPPAAFDNWRYLAVTVAAGLTGFFASHLIDRVRTPVLLFDAAGLCLFAVTGTPPALIDRMQAVVAEAIKDPKVKERLDPTGADLVANTPAEFKTWIAGQRELLGKLIVEAGIKLQ
eukprot:gene45755-61160_t